MPARIGHNAHLKEVSRHVGVHYAGASRQVESLASGQRVNRASDDPASLALADGIRSEVRALAEGGRNVQQSISLLQVAEGALGEMTAILQRMEGLATQVASETYNDADRAAMAREFRVLKEELDRIATFTTYNGIPLLHAEQEFAIQAGPSETSNDVSRIWVGDMRASGPRLAMESLSVGTTADARRALEGLQQAQQALLGERNRIAAFQNRLQLTATTTAGILQAMYGSEAEIRGVDMAASVGVLTRSQIVAETAAALASDASTDVERVLSLLQ
ncbi:MAG: flagellin [Candidatus Latescibacterota bacterium]